MQAEQDRIHTVRRSRRFRVGEIRDHIDSGTHIVSNTESDFRACMGHVELLGGDSLALTRGMAKALAVEPGSYVRYVSFELPKNVKKTGVRVDNGRV